MGVGVIDLPEDTGVEDPFYHKHIIFNNNYKKGCGLTSEVGIRLRIVCWNLLSLSSLR